MLALAPSHPGSSAVHTVPLRPHTASSSTETYTLQGHRPPARKLQSAFATLPSYASSSSSSHSLHSQSRSASESSLHDSAGPSARRSVAQSTPPSHPVQQAAHRDRDHEEDPQTPPASDSEDNDDEVVQQPEQSTTVDVNDYDSDKLLGMLASTLNRIAKLNSTSAGSNYMSTPLRPPHSSDSEHYGPIWRTLTSASRESLARAPALTFHARQVPTIGLDSYLQRIQKYCPASNEVFISLLVYLDRMTRLARDACGEIIPIDFYNVHRLIIAGITVASKFFSDVFYTNSRYAKVGGLPLAELNLLELQFLLLNDFHLTITPEEMQYYTKMVDLQSKIDDDVSVAPFLPATASPMTPGASLPVGPTEYFAAVGTYIQHQHALIHPSALGGILPPGSAPLFLTGPGQPRPPFAIRHRSDGTEADSEADYTDDEPTIRAPNSSGESASETTSLHSSSASEDTDANSIYTDESDASRDDHNVRLFARQ